MPIQLGGHSYQARAGRATAQRLVNMYLEANPQGAKSPASLICTPGLVEWIDVGTGPIRGLHHMGSALYVVSGAELYSVDSGGNATLLGSIGGNGHVRMTDNGSHVGIATSQDTYAANASGVVALPESGMVGATYQDGYGIFAQGGTEKFWITGIDDMTTIDALDFSTADVFADTLVGCISNHRELWLFGKTTIEGWYNSGAAAFPFERAQGAFLEIGCVSGDTIAKAQRSVLWLGDDLFVYQAQGYQAQKVSTPAIDKLIADASDHTSSRAFVYDQEGHTHYVLSFSGLTVVYDLTTGLWHERKSQGIDRWRASCYAEAFGHRLVGDYDTGKVHELSLDAYSDNGAEIQRIITSPPVASMGTRVSMGEFCLDMDAGQGLNAGQGSAPLAMLDWSDDGGESWSNQHEASLGAMGRTLTQVKWTRLGQFRERTLRVTISDPVKCNIVGAYASLVGGVS